MTTSLQGRRSAAALTLLASSCTVLTMLLVPSTAGADPAAPTASPVAAAAAAAARAGAAAPAVTLRADRSVARVGQRIRLTGRARAPRGAQVRLQVRVGAQRRWDALARTKVRAAGRIRYVVTPTTSGAHRFRACVSKPSRQCSRPVKVKVRSGAGGQTPVTLAVSPLTGTYETGQSVTVTGTASTNLAGRGVQLQAPPGAPSSDGSWSTMATARVSADGSFSLTGPLPTPGRAVRLRVLAPATPTTREASAPAGTLEVFGWYYLHDGGPVAEAAGDWCPIKEDRAVAGVTVPRSIGFGIHCKDVNWAEVALERQCRSFETRMGLSDDPYDTAPEVRYAARFLVDGVERFNQPEMAPGQVWDVRLDLTGAQRLRLEVPFVSGPKGLVILGGARVNCAL